jgi:excisionase family DNA binding protein
MTMEGAAEGGRHGVDEGGRGEAVRGGVGRKTLYKAVASGDLKVARIGAGRSILFCETWIDEWLRASAGAAAQQDGGVGQARAQTTGLRLVERRTA